MKGLVLAGGRGSRLAPLTDDRPKTLVEVEGRTLLDRQVAALMAAGVDEVGIVTGWMAEGFATLPHTTFGTDRWATSQMIDDLRLADPWLSRDSCIVAYGDIIFHPADARRLVARAADVAIAYDPAWLDAWSRRFADPLDDAELFLHRSGWLVEAGGPAPSLRQADGQYIGLLATTAVGWRSLMRIVDRAQQEDPVVDVTDTLTRAVRAGQPVAVVPISGPWWEVDHPRDIELGRDIFLAIDRLLFGDTRSPVRRG